jgi:hypothetical protein
MTRPILVISTNEVRRNLHPDKQKISRLRLEMTNNIGCHFEGASRFHVISTNEVRRNLHPDKQKISRLRLEMTMSARNDK